MQALKSGPAVPSWVAASLISLLIGGAGGFYISNWSSRQAVAAPGGSRGGGMPMMGGMGGMGGGMGGAQQHPNAMSLVRTVGALNTLEKARGKEFADEQRSKLATVLTSLKGDTKLTEEQCEAKLAEVKAVLNFEQQSLLEEMTASPGGRGGAGGPGASAGRGNSPGGARSGYPGGGSGYPGGGGGMMGGGQGPDLERPFAEGRNKERLEELVKLLGK